MNHEHLALEDTLNLVGELEHSRRHNLRAYYSVEEPDHKFFHLVSAAQAQTLRRKVQAKLPDIVEDDWCAVKSAAAIRQLNYELMSGDEELFKELEAFVDSQYTHALKQDMSGCQSCRSDKESMLAGEE